MENAVSQVTGKFGDKELLIETGKLAMLAHGACTVRYGETVVLATVVSTPEPKEGADFFPLLVDYEERLYAAGKISGSRFIKREGRPSDQAVLNCRLVDRAIRPLFPKDYRHDVQVVITVLSVDLENEPDILALIAASTALMLSGAPFEGPVAACRVGLIDNELIINPSTSQIAGSLLDLTVAGTKEKIMMLEAGCQQVPEEKILEAIEFGHQQLKEVLSLQTELAKDVGKVEVEGTEFAKVHAEVKKFLGKKIAKVAREADRTLRETQITKFQEEVLANFEGNYKQIDLKNAFDRLLEAEVRQAIVKDKIRPDGRGLDEVREISIEVGLLPRTHGSGLFTRGQTQALTIATLGSPGKEQIIETMEEEGTKRFMHHYNFPPFSTGEVAPMRSVSRRSIGHGALAEKALLPVIPSREEFPYTIRLVSEILSSNGSSSMAATCGATLALMDAGVPIKAPVAGVAMGLVTDGDDSVILTDIQGLEDFAGDMDFKIAGTKDGVTAIQLDTKLKGLPIKVLQEAMTQAKKSRLEILEKMLKVIPEPRKELSPLAPRVTAIQIKPEQIREVIGPGGKIINQIIAECGGAGVTSIDIEDDGTVLVSSASADNSTKAVDWIKNLTRQVTSGEVFEGKVTRILDFGAFVEIKPGQEGMIHISQLAPYHVNKVQDIVKVGQIVKVKVINIDEQNRVNLSMKAVGNKVEG